MSRVRTPDLSSVFVCLLQRSDLFLERGDEGFLGSAFLFEFFIELLVIRLFLTGLFFGPSVPAVRGDNLAGLRIKPADEGALCPARLLLLVPVGV